MEQSNIECLTQDAGNHAQFRVGPLTPGFGVTIGNSLRRVLLSSLPGAAATAVRIEGVTHQYMPLPGMREDVTDLILNLKGLRIADTLSEEASVGPRIITMEIDGPGIVTGADIKCPTGLEVVNPDFYLCELGNDGRLRLELYIERGTGYRQAAEGTGELGFGWIPMDAHFSPIQQVTFHVDVQQQGGTPVDILDLDVTTDGTISPMGALARSALLLSEQLNPIIALDSSLQVAPRVENNANEATDAFQNMPIEDLQLSVRTYNALKRGGVRNVGQLLELTNEDLLQFRNFGEKSLDEVRERVMQLMASETPEPALE